jgi:hypothetical protein
VLHDDELAVDRHDVAEKLGAPGSRNATSGIVQGPGPDVQGATRILRISWDEACPILERAVERGLRAKRPRVTRHVGVDEKTIVKGHRYFALVRDLVAYGFRKRDHFKTVIYFHCRGLDLHPGLPTEKSDQYFWWPCEAA